MERCGPVMRTQTYGTSEGFQPQHLLYLASKHLQSFPFTQPIVTILMIPIRTHCPWLFLVIKNYCRNTWMIIPSTHTNSCLNMLINSHMALSDVVAYSVIGGVKISGSHTKPPSGCHANQLLIRAINQCIHPLCAWSSPSWDLHFHCHSQLIFHHTHNCLNDYYISLSKDLPECAMY